MPGSLVHDLTVVAIEWRPCGPMDSLQRAPAAPAEFRSGRITGSATGTYNFNRARRTPRDLSAAQRGAAAAAEFCGRGLVEAAARTASLIRRGPGARSTLRPT